ncbi:hypothetical protein [Candidatus Enterococcus clewellii]|uniref:Calcineurin-like phosphoesterase domain-containing protein n=1 Tax=Candidatus Enterococcus clewellii TaxID=1834193 RepID=A0A242K6E1_9ENTE|nr:hypothetical protein [Enterococcus sp. 9E7_DIV0242]OTP15774.1 hypothetical protein A5888_001988 [Enterococcus sp. 9E7_DIV0242]
MAVERDILTDETQCLQNNIGLSGVYDTLEELQNSYPNGKEGLFEVIADRDLYTYSNGSWTRLVGQGCDDLMQKSRVDPASKASLPAHPALEQASPILVDPKALPFGSFHTQIAAGVTENMPKNHLIGQHYMNKNGVEGGGREYYDLINAVQPVYWTGVRSEYMNEEIHWTYHGLNPDEYLRALSTHIYGLKAKRERYDITNRVTFLQETDTHVAKHQHDIGRNNIAPLNIDRFEAITTLLNDDYDFRCHLGDWFDGEGPKNESFADLHSITKVFFSRDKKSFGVVGNHDYNCVYPTTVIPADQPKDFFSHEEVLSFFHKSTHPDTIYKDNMYYTDLVNKKIRVIVLNAFDNEVTPNASGSINILVRNTSSYGNKQVTDYYDTLTNTPADYNVIVLTHNTFQNVINTINQINGTTMRQISEAFQNSKRNNVTETGIKSENMEYDYYKLGMDIDFTGKPKNRIIGIFSGHLHADHYKNINNINYIVSKNAYFSGIGQGGIINTLTEAAFDIIDIDLDRKIVYCNRIGWGVDKRFVYGKNLLTNQDQVFTVTSNGGSNEVTSLTSFSDTVANLGLIYGQKCEVSIDVTIDTPVSGSFRIETAGSVIQSILPTTQINTFKPNLTRRLSYTMTVGTALISSTNILKTAVRCNSVSATTNIQLSNIRITPL